MKENRAKTNNTSLLRTKKIHSDWMQWGKNKYFDAILKNPDEVKKHLLFMLYNGGWDWYNVARCLDKYPRFTFMLTRNQWELLVSDECIKQGHVDKKVLFKDKAIKFSKTFFGATDTDDLSWYGAFSTVKSPSGNEEKKLIIYYDVSQVSCDLPKNHLIDVLKQNNELVVAFNEIENSKEGVDIDTIFKKHYQMENWEDCLVQQLLEDVGGEKLLRNPSHKDFFISAGRFLLDAVRYPQKETSFNKVWSWEKASGFSSVSAYMLLEDIVQSLPVYLKNIFYEGEKEFLELRKTAVIHRLNSITINDRKNQAKNRKAAMSSNQGGDTVSPEGEDYQNSFEAQDDIEMEEDYE